MIQSAIDDTILVVAFQMEPILTIEFGRLGIQIVANLIQIPYVPKLNSNGHVEKYLKDMINYLVARPKQILKEPINSVGGGEGYCITQFIGSKCLRYFL